MRPDYKELKAISNEMISIMKGRKTPSSGHFEKWYTTNPYAKQIVEHLSDEQNLANELNQFDTGNLKHNSAKKLQKSIQQRRYLFVARLATVAAALIVVSFLVTNPTSELKDIVLLSNDLETVIEPTLILSNGSNIPLNNVNGLEDNSITISKGNKAEIVYNAKHKEVPETELRYNTLIIPNKYNYRITLSDGTKVTLNSGSKLVYPIAFKSDTRKITLDGEAYFEVTKSDKPFIVECNGIEVKVYGTKFNVNSYNPEMIKTTLFEGSVGVKSSITTDNNEHLLKANQSLELSPTNGTFTLKTIDTDRYKSWVNGYFYANGETLENMLLSIGKWYDLNFEYMDYSKKNIALVGVFDRDLPLDKILKTIEEVTNVKIIKNERGYMVK